MPAGVYRMGLGPGGLDPSADPPERVAPRKATTGRYYDVAARDYTIDSKGRANEEHPVDAWVKLQITIALESIASDVTHGNGVAGIEYITPSTRARVENIVRALVQPKVSSKEIKTLRIHVMTDGRTNRIGITYEYTNLVTGRQKKASA